VPSCSLTQRFFFSSCDNEYLANFAICVSQ
jgi:hypothetical protein